MRQSVLLNFSFLVLGLTVFMLYRCVYWLPVYRPENNFASKADLTIQLDAQLDTIDCHYPRPKVLFTGETSTNAYVVEHFRAFPWGLDLNTAGEHLLTVVHGIGPSRARKIVVERSAGGLFSDENDFAKRTGIDPQLFRRYKGWVYVSE